MSLLLKQSTAVTLTIGPFVDQTDGFTAETVLTIAQADVRLSKNGGTYAQKADATSCTHQENGYYSCPLNTSDTNTLGHLRLAVNEAGALPVWQDFLVVPAAVYDALVSGTGNGVRADVQVLAAGAITASAFAAGAIDNAAFNVTETLTANPAAGGITAASFGAGAIDAAAIATDAIGSVELAASAVDEIVNALWDELTSEARVAGSYGQLFKDNVNAAISSRAVPGDLMGLVAGAITSAKFAAGAIDAAAIGTGAVDADALAADASEEILKAAAGTADSGTTTTMVDAERTEAGTDYWKDMVVFFTGGTNAGLARRVSAFDPATDTITFGVALPNAVAVGHTYIILRTAIQEAAAGGSSDWSAAEKNQIRDALGVDGTKTAATGGQVQTIKTKTDQLVFTIANKVDASIQAAGDFAQAAADKVWASTTRTLTALGDALVDEVFKRNLSAVTGEAARSLLNAIRFLRNKWSISGTTLTVTKEDDVTTAWTATLTATPGADPITAKDPD